ncbi:hypothetical protein B0I35DRAFT_472958 [Stachybotrys elegans]|uniref:J domain-containing protein n=1 Tax=Stachybotrys elegans TaxID=80388 RepID=A0A8K0T1L6_9HYPO|nr:hypothetical protein B0I35DRAFT_472958 [Stachybotrys elegans]
MAAQRDYYADLELPRTADIQEIKKQFRKLALKYHPDRNPGREQEVNAKFQTIQSAHEVLSDPQKKSQYDATLPRSRYPTASGVKGNPWSHVSEQFPAPPRRKPPASGAQRWNQRFASGVPPTAKQQASSDSESRQSAASAARAFESMRTKASNQQRETPQAPPPPPPRSETARQRQQASFGNRKPSYAPRTSAQDDEPPATPARNNTARHHASSSSQVPQASPIPDPFSQFREREYGHDARQSSPYTTHGGEKTNPFDGVPIGRAKSTREPAHRPTSQFPAESTFSPRRQRSNSVPKDTQEPVTPKADRVPKEARRPDANQRSTKVPGHAPDGSLAQNGAADMNSPSKPTTPGGSTMYATLHHASHSNIAGGFPHSRPHDFCTCPTAKRRCSTAQHPPHKTSLSARKSTPSGGQNFYDSLTPFEKRQFELLICLINNKHTGQSPRDAQPSLFVLPCQRDEEIADKWCQHSFTFPIDHDTFAQTPHRTNSHNSVEDINTKFAEDHTTKPWQFSAGGSTTDGSPISRSPAGSRSSRRSPTRPAVSRPEDTNSRNPQTDQMASGFNPDGWSDKFGPQTFEPPPRPPASASPTRPARANTKKTRAAAKTAGGYAVVEDDSSDEEPFQWTGRKGSAPAPTATFAASPQAMDIDSPTPTTSTTPPPQNGSNGARNMNVEPSRPEWRPGDVNHLNGDALQGEQAKKQFKSPNLGSEDSEEFRATLDDLKNVAPFAQDVQGLKSLSDLKANLPFESKASTASVNLPQVQPLAFPDIPEAPRLPPTVAISGMKPNVPSWEKYLREFEVYLQRWDIMHALVLAHFSTRLENLSQARQTKGYGFLGVRGDSEVYDYFVSVQQDNEVRRRWSAACEEHEKRLREFMAFREKMK